MNSERQPAAQADGDEQHETDFTVGVEEEFQIVDAETRDLSQNVERILAAAQTSLGNHVDHELRPSMIETKTPPATLSASYATSWPASARSLPQPPSGRAPVSRPAARTRSPKRSSRP